MTCFEMKNVVCATAIRLVIIPDPGLLFLFAICCCVSKLAWANRSTRTPICVSISASGLGITFQVRDHNPLTSSHRDCFTCRSPLVCLKDYPDLSPSSWARPGYQNKLDKCDNYSAHRLNPLLIDIQLMG